MCNIDLSTFIYVYTTHFLGFVNRFLSWEGFTVVSRLTYVGYLIHMSVLFVFMNQFTFSLGFTHIFIVSVMNNDFLFAETLSLVTSRSLWLCL